ncbi:ATP-dependent Clp protease proteolytic subunit [Prauserella cavernicola]|uniref:ATP-dependent Clp protease proteolytic subunit n=1 Tax=Prauserella cavernicola TaxID=2800127 RepID=A0A934QP06_9PSEU|nr:ATP-dependent Clp protease proteolytic subunit [Prauserella cavernicola]MBK1783436.1 ATP-dependent Clp protease proteolytic subunit [Prauserella cavernicola]
MTAPDGHSRHIPSFVERTGYGLMQSTPYQKLFEDRQIMLGAPIDDVSANDVMVQLLHLEYENPERDILLYLNSPGGSITSLMAIYDTMRYIHADVATVCLGQAADAAAVLLAAGAPGKRLALPGARVVLTQPSVEGVRGQVSDLEIQAAEIGRRRAQLESILAWHTGREPDAVSADLERTTVLTADQARERGIVDEVLPARRAVA